jgi:hypothetical protein
MARKHLRDVRGAAMKVDRARDELSRAMLAARESGETLRDIAHEAGLSHQQVANLLKELARRQEQE